LKLGLSVSDQKPSPKQNETEFDGSKVLNLFSESASKILGRLILIGIVGFSSAWIYGFAYADLNEILLSLFIGISILLVSYLEFRARRVERGLIILCWALWLYACVFGFVVAGIRTPVLIVMPPLIMIIAWVQGKRPMLIMLSCSVAILVCFVVAEKMQWLGEPRNRTSFQILIVYLTVVAISGVIALVLADNFKRLFEKSRGLTVELQRRVTELKTSEQATKDLNDQLEHRVWERTVQYDEANKKLQALVSKLELAQTELVNAEKLASLGSMVAGISHELNTPIGNVLTLTTSMENHYQEMMHVAAQGNFKRSVFEEFLRTGYEMSVLATRSTKRAVDLVSSFKQVAVDQTSDQRRNFELREVVEDNIATLWPSIKKRTGHVIVENLVPEKIFCDSFPGPLGQVIVNLTQNAILHGLANAANGRITIDAEDQVSLVKITVSDNGVGMAPNILAHIFDPFFTTKLGKGGSGLGLSISYRIVTSVLGGNITVISTPGQGAQFTISFPKTAPYKL